MKCLQRAISILVASILLTGAATIAVPSAQATPAFAFTRLSGATNGTRYDTAAAVALSGFTVADTVVLATGENFPDALASNFLAGLDGAPILLTPSAGPVPSATMNALVALKTKNVIILGLQQAVGQSVHDQLATTRSTSAAGGMLNVTRIGGATRYDTMKALIDPPPQGSVGNFAGLRTALVASGVNFPDALAAGPVSWAKHFPTILTDPASLSPQAGAALKDLGIQQVAIVGGALAVSPTVEAAIRSQGILLLQRLSGADRSETSNIVADYAIANFGFANTTLDMVTGAQALGGVDALVAGPYAGQHGPAPLLVTNSSTIPGKVGDFAAEHSTTLASGIAFGGPAALPDTTLASVSVAAVGAGAANYGFVSGAANASPTVDASRLFIVAGMGTTPVDIRLASCADLVATRGGTTFAGTNPGGSGSVAAFPTANSAALTLVNGVAPSSGGSAAFGVAPQSGGTITIAITDAANECVVPVVYSAADDMTNNHNLELDPNGVPVEPYAVGGLTFFIPSPAASGPFGGLPPAPNGTITQYDLTQRYFVQSGGGMAATYTYNPGDTFSLFSTVTNACQASTIDGFAARLSTGDAITGSYNPSAKSSFCLVDQAPVPPGPLTPTNAFGLSATASNVGVTVRFSDSATASVAAFAVYRAPANAPLVTGAPFTCPVVAAGSPQTPPAVPYARLTTLPDKSFNGQPEGAYTYVDAAVNAGAHYCYAVTSIDGTPQGQESGATGAGPVQAVAVLPPPAHPAFVHAVFSGTDPSAITVKVIYNEGIACSSVDPDGSDYAVTYTNNGVTQAVKLDPAVFPVCDNNGTFDTGSNLGQVTLTITPSPPNIPPSGSTVLIRSRTGIDANSVFDLQNPPNSQLTSDAVQTTA